jgi:hypothetical protein
MTYQVLVGDGPPPRQDKGRCSRGQDPMAAGGEHRVPSVAARRWPVTSGGRGEDLPVERARSSSHHGFDLRKTRLGRQVLMCELKDVAKWVAHHRPSVAIGRIEWCLDGGSSGRERLLICLVRIIDIDVEERRKQVTLRGGRHHDQGIANADLGWAAGLDVSGRVEHGTKKGDLSRHVDHHDARGDGVIPDS